MSGRSHWILAGIATGIWILLLALHAGMSLEVCDLSRFDEFLALSRSRGILESGDPFTIYSNGLPNFNKPPLQYWISAVLMAEGLSPQMALRLPSLGFGVLTLGVTALLAVELDDRRDPWVALASVLFLSTSLLFQEHLGVGMLETGLTFFVVSSVYLVSKARRDPRWWLLWGLACGLGALQKVPVALILSGLFVLVVREELGGLANLVRDRWFQTGLVLNLALTAFWPVLQSVRSGSDFYQKAQEESVGRLVGGTFSIHFSRLGWLLVDCSTFWCLALVTLLVALVSRKALFREARCRGIMAVFALIALAMVLGSGRIHPRYWLSVTPLMCALTSVMISQVSKKYWVAPVLAFACLTYQAGRIGEVPFRKTENQGVVFPLRCTTRSLYEGLGPDEQCFVFVEPGWVAASLTDVPYPQHLSWRTEERPTDSLPHYGIVGKAWMKRFPHIIDVIRTVEEIGPFSVVEFKMLPSETSPD
jgi:4-amino-4-deoxy-L-arabinose transferase-like glycosyltransferase